MGLLLVLWGLVQATVQQPPIPTDWRPKAIDARQTPNLLQISQRVYSGGAPHGEGAFDELSRLGIKTVISVDGAAPDVEAAKKAGLRYIHLPHGYDGIPERRILEIAKAIQTADGPVLIHCHRGKHRSPAAAAAACAALGEIEPPQALEVLQAAGTGKNYLGLFEVAKNAQKVDPQKIRDLTVEFQATTPAPPLVEAMGELEIMLERLQKLEKNAWKPLEKEPDLDPAHQALLLREIYTELLRQKEIESRPAEFRKWMQEAEKGAKAVEKELTGWKEKAYAGETPSELAKLTAGLAESCQKCHAAYRDNVRRER